MSNALQIFYTYLWLRDDGTPYYVGKGKGNRAYVGNRHKVPVPIDKSRILIQEYPSESDAFATEIFLISYYGRKDVGTGVLRNLTDGGDNPPRAQKGWGRGKKLTLSHKHNIGEANKVSMKGNKNGLGKHSNQGQLSWNHGKIGVSSLTRQRMSDSAKRRHDKGR